VQTISSRRNPIVSEYRRAARAGAGGGPLLLDGAHLIADAEAAGLLIRSAAVVAARLAASAEMDRLVRRLDGRGVPVFTVPAPVMAAMSPVRTPSGVVALADRPEGRLARALEGARPLVAAAVDVQDPGNLGAIVRAAEAAGATGLIACGRSADPYGWKALRGAMGSAFRLPIAAAVAVPDALAALRARGIRVCAAVPGRGESIYAAPLDGPVAILLGGEGAGLPAEVVAQADVRLHIPMQPPVESLNVAVAAALFLFEAARQRAGIPHVVR